MKKNLSFMKSASFVEMFIGLAALTLCLVLLQGCVTGQDGHSTNISEPRLTDQGYLSLFLNLKEKNSPAVGMEIQRIDILTQNGNWLPLTNVPIRIHTNTIKEGQIFLLRSRLRPGYYSRIRLTTTSAWLGNSLQPRDDFPVSNQAIEIRLPDPLYIGRGDSQSVFLTWDVRRSLKTIPSDSRHT